uniref:Uncharacterized protein n=1 Tax=Rhizophora mucronata TaxID=61149 RepID=A0A2P2NWI2_RHIMU
MVVLLFHLSDHDSSQTFSYYQHFGTSMTMGVWQASLLSLSVENSLLLLLLQSLVLLLVVYSSSCC